MQGWHECKRITKEGTDFGSAVHKALEKLLKGESYKAASEGLSPEQDTILTKFAVWLHENEVKPVAVEESVFSEKHCFGGTPDLLCKMNGSKKLWIVDWKTGKHLDRKSHKYQMAGYSLAYKNQYDIRVVRGIVVQMGSNGDEGEYRNEALHKLWDGFIRLREGYREWTGR